MDSSSLRHSAPSSTGVLPVFTTCFGPRMAAAGLVGSTWPVISQSNSIRTPQVAALTPGAECSCCRPSIYVATSNGRIAASVRPRCSHQVKNRRMPRHRLGAYAGCGCWRRRIRHSVNSRHCRRRRSGRAPTSVVCPSEDMISACWMVARGRGVEAAQLVATKRSLTHFWRGKARPGESGEVAIRMLLEVGLKLLAPIAVLHGFPESEIEGFCGEFLGCRRRRARR
jgi:hypothetical protein